MTNLMFKGKLVIRLVCLIGAILFLSSNDAKATHIVGGDLTYRCLGNNMYRLTLTVRRDCLLGAADAPFDDPASIGIFDLITGQRITNIVGFPMGHVLIPLNHSDTLNEILVSDCSVVMGDVCVHTTMYVVDVALPYRPSGYSLVYQRCCRNSSLNNVVDPLDTGMTLVADLSGNAQLDCNSSPQFGAFPPIYTCVNKPIMFDHSALDLEGDSLVYELCTPLSGASTVTPQPQPPMNPPYLPIIWRAPYSLANLMGGVPLQIDQNTGLLTGTPNTIGQFVIGICVTAYEDGVMTGKTRRDFQVNVRLCRDVPVAQFSAPSLDCEDLTVEFDNQSLLADNYKWIFDFDNYPNSDSSFAFEPTYTYPQSGFYNVALIASDSFGFCYDTIIHQVGVFDSQIDADFTYDVSACTEAGIVLNVTDASFGFDPNFPACSYEWLLTVDGNIIPSTDQNPTFNFDIDGSATVLLALVVTSCNGCSATQVKSFPVNEISINVDPDSEHLCRGDTTHLLIGCDSSLTYTWDPQTGLDLTNPCDPLAYPGLSVTYCVTVTDGLCEVSDCIPVTVQQLPVLAFDYETDCKSLTVQFDNNSTGGTLFHWDFGTTNPADTLLTPLINPTFTFPDSGIYTVTLSSRDGCDVSISQEITANAISETLDDQLINCFMNGIFLNPDTVPGYLYDWSGGLDDVPNPFAIVTDDTEFFVTISSPGLPGCEIIDSVTVVIPDDFTVDAGGDIISCVLTDILLTASTTGNDNVDFLWTDCNNTTLSNDSTLLVSPTVTDTFCVVATDTLGCSMSDFVIVTRQEPGFDVGASNDQAYCNIQTITLTGSSTVGGVTPLWLNAAGDTIGDQFLVDVTPGTPACFIFIGTEIASGCQESDTVCLTPTFINLDITDDQSICLEDSIELCVTDNIGQNLTYIWSPIELIIHGGVTACPLVDPPTTQEYCVTVTNHPVGCMDTLCTTVVVNLFEPLDVVITSDPPDPILTQPVTLSTNQPSTYMYSWSAVPPTEESIPPIPNPTVVPTAIPTTFSVTVTNEAGCTNVATLTITPRDPSCDESDIFLPNAFTPNDDGVNDVLYVKSNFIETFEIHIYNRWGEEVFTSNDVNFGWNGTYKGKKLPPDVFGYYMEVGCPNEKSYSEKGNITLLE